MRAEIRRLIRSILPSLISFRLGHHYDFPTSLARREILGRVPSTTILETTESTVFRVLAPAIQT